MNYLALFFLFGITNAFVKVGSDWIDPHDMNAKVKHKYMPAAPKPLSGSSDTILEPLQDVCFSHIKRVISVIIKSAYIDKSNPEQYHGHVRFNIQPEDYDFLDTFGQEDITLDKLRKLNTILGSSFHRSLIDKYLNAVESFQMKIYSLIVNVGNLWLLGTIWILYVTYQLFKNDFAITYIFKYLIIMVMIVDFGFRYHHLLKEAEEHNMGVVYSKECDPSRMSWSEWTVFMVGSKNCEKKTITPLDAFLYQIKHLIIIPMQAFGTGMGGFGKNMFTDLPWGLNIIMWPVMLIFTLLLTVFSMTILTGQSIEFNIFHIIKMKFGGGSNDALPGARVERILDKAMHRPMIQVVSDKSKDKKTDDKKDKGKSKDTLQIGAGDGSRGADEAVTAKNGVSKSKKQSWWQSKFPKEKKNEGESSKKAKNESSKVREKSIERTVTVKKDPVDKVLSAEKDS